MILEAILIGTAGGVAIFIARTFPFSKSPETSYREYLMSDSYKEAERENNIFKQELEDIKMKREISHAASDEFFGSIHAKLNGQMFWCPIRQGFIYEIFDEETAKYKGDITEYINSEIKKLKVEYKDLYDETSDLAERKVNILYDRCK